MKFFGTVAWDCCVDVVNIVSKNVRENPKRIRYFMQCSSLVTRSGGTRISFVKTCMFQYSRFCRRKQGWLRLRRRSHLRIVL